MGIPASYKPVNDILTDEGRKISGTGVAEIEDYLILVGNVIMDFDYETMVRVLKVPDEKYRDKVHKSLRENMSTIKRELGAVPPVDEVSALLAANYEAALGRLERAELPPAVYHKVSELEGSHTTDEWLHKRGRRSRERTVKIATGVEVVQRIHKVPGGLIRATVETREGRIADVSLSGDFFFYPADRLEALEVALAGVAFSALESTIADFYGAEGIESPGVTPSDFARALLGPPVR
jgi:lipoate-protein ligase A